MAAVRIIAGKGEGNVLGRPARTRIRLDGPQPRPFGPRWLKDERTAQEIIDAFHFGQHQLEFYELYSFVIMPNHVHLLLQPKVQLARITKLLKGYMARRAN